MQVLKHLLTLCFLVTLTTIVTAQNNEVFDIPFIESITIDGKINDWPDDAFKVQLLANPDGSYKEPNDFDVKVNMGWDKKGLLLLVMVQDNLIVEHPNKYKLWSYDSFNLIMAPDKSSKEIFQLNISPGLSTEFPELRYYVFDDRYNLKKNEIKVELVREKTSKGYTLEIRLPWENLSISAKAGATAALQMYGTDSDKKENGFHIPWYPEFGAQENPALMYLVRLSTEASPTDLVFVSAKIETMKRRKTNIVTESRLEGESVKIFNSAGTLAEEKLTLQKGRPAASFTLPLPAIGETALPLKAEIAGQYVKQINFPDVNELRANEYVKAELKFDEWIFNRTSFPTCRFEQSYYVEDLIGPYSIETTFYNGDFEEVTLAETAGRYGAVVNVIPENGQPLRKFFNIYKYPGNFQWWQAKIDAPNQLFEGFGIDSSIVASQSESIKEFSKWRLMQDFQKEPMGVFLLANLSDAPVNSKSLDFRGLYSLDKKWWLNLKHKLYKTDGLYPDSIVCPEIIPNLEATTLREDSPQEAGIKEGNISKVDSVCNMWSNDSDQAFAVLLARNGVIYFHKAYGQRNGNPMTINTESWMASITKLLSGTLMMMLVDQDLVKLDDPVEKFLPPFRNVEGEKKLTIRNLYNHTNGLPDQWGDNNNDLEEIIGALYPSLHIGEEYAYNGCGFALGGKIIELISGETIPEFYKKHLLNPLDCESTIVTGTAGDASSTPIDMAKISQMLLNKGSYGNKKFFSEETFNKMLPLNLSEFIEKKTPRNYGVGTVLFDKEGFGKGTFGHTAASSATLRIDPENKLVVVMTRNKGGSNFEKYHPLFIEAVLEGLTK